MDSGFGMKRFLVMAILFVLLWPAAVRAQIVSYYHLDAVGNVLAVTDTAGVVIEQHDYLPFGDEWNPTPGDQPKRFTGKERDPETGLDYFGARYYGSKIGRFTTTDPVYTWRENLVDPQRWNRYAYARNNPLRYVDPDGRQIAPPALMITTVNPPGNEEARLDFTIGLVEGALMLIPGLEIQANSPAQAQGQLFGQGFGLASLGLGMSASQGAAARGGIGPVLKGEAGVQRSIAAAEARGELVMGREITIDTSAARTRIDIATKTPEGRLKFIECKNGPCAGLTPNQRAAFPEIRSQGGVPRGANAAKAGLKPGEPIGPTETVVERH